MKKVICAIYNKDGSIKREQRTVDMHPLEVEQLMISSEHDRLVASLTPMSKDEEHELLIEQGPEAVRLKRAEHKALCEAKELEIAPVQRRLAAATERWNRHAEKCHKHGHDKDTFIGNAGVLLD